MTAPPAAPAPADHHRHPTQYSEHHTRRASDSMMMNRQADHQQQQPSQTPPPNDTSHFTNTQAPLINDVQVITAPPSPECPPSPPPAAPSGYALALARMVEMNADMEFGELFT